MNTLQISDGLYLQMSFNSVDDMIETLNSFDGRLKDIDGDIILLNHIRGAAIFKEKGVWNLCIPAMEVIRGSFKILNEETKDTGAKKKKNLKSLRKIWNLK